MVHMPGYICDQRITWESQFSPPIIRVPEIIPRQAGSKHLYPLSQLAGQQPLLLKFLVNIDEYVTKE